MKISKFGTTVLVICVLVSAYFPLKLFKYNKNDVLVEDAFAIVVNSEKNNDKVTLSSIRNEAFVENNKVYISKEKENGFFKEIEEIKEKSPVDDEFINFATNVFKDIKYGDGDFLTLDLYLPKKSNTLLVWIHGGGWDSGDKETANQTFKLLSEYGYAVAYVNYDLTNLSSHPQQIHDIKGAIRWLRANASVYGYGTKHVVIGGGSAGGHLALLLGLSSGVEELEGDVGGNLEYSSSVDGVVDFYGVSDLVEFDNESESFNRYKDFSVELLKSLSPTNYISSDDPPVIIFHGDGDETVSINQSILLDELYKKNNLKSYLNIIEGASHGGDKFSDLERLNLINDFLTHDI